MSKAATAGNDRRLGKNDLRPVEHPGTRFMPTVELPHAFRMQPDIIEFKGKHGRVVNRAQGTETALAECSARCSGISGVFNEISLRVSVFLPKQRRYLTVESGIKELPSVTQEQAGKLVKNSFWRDPLMTRGPNSKTRGEFLEEQLSGLAKRVGAVARKATSDPRQQIELLLEETKTSISQRLDIEIALLNSPVVTKGKA